MSRSAWCAVVCVMAVCYARPALAYPEMIAKGYTTCGSCHYNPTGGGFINSYGMAAQQSAWPDQWKSDTITRLREGTLAKANVTGYDDDGNAELQLGLDFDSRFMLTSVPSSVGSSVGFNFFPMLLEFGGVVAWGKFLVYGAIGPKEPEGDGISWKTVSREHWLQFKATDELSVRVGRMVLPFGLRIPDHTAFTRSDFGFGYYNQTYAAEADYVSEHITASLAGSVGNPFDQPSRLRERGGAASVAFNVPSWASVGVSGLYESSDLVDRSAVSLFGRTRIVDHLYVMAEVAGQHKSVSSTNDSENNLATLLRLGWFVQESLNLYVQHDFRATEGSAVSAQRYTVGANWWLLPWVEMAPMVQVIDYPQTGSYIAGFIQAHIYY